MTSHKNLTYLHTHVRKIFPSIFCDRNRKEYPLPFESVAICLLPSPQPFYILFQAFSFFDHPACVFRANPYVNFTDDIATICAQSRCLVSVESERKSNRSRSSVADSPCDKPRATRFNDHVSNPISHERVFSRERLSGRTTENEKENKKRVKNKPLYIGIVGYLLNFFSFSNNMIFLSISRITLAIIVAIDKILLPSYMYTFWAHR